MAAGFSIAPALALGAAHYVAQDTPVPPPGGDAQLDHAVDVTAVFLGFGVFTANAALLVESFESGSMIGQGLRRLGSLGPLEIAYALALRVELIGADLDDIREHLRPDPRAWIVDATRDLRGPHAKRIEALRRIEHPALGPYRS